MNFLRTILKWVVGLAALSGLLAGAYFVHDRIQQKKAAQIESDKLDTPKRAENGIVKLGKQLAESHGIKDEPAKSIAWQPRLTAYGRVVPNPQATIEIRSPFAGTLRLNADAPWPRPGQWLQAGQVLGRIDIRIGPQERLDLQAKFNEARLRLQGAEEVLKVHEARADRLRKFGTTDIVSRREIDEAMVQLTEARTARTTAKAAVELWQKALTLIEQPRERPASTWSELLIAPSEGEVTELAARPGMAVESGGLLARVVDFRRPLVRLDLPSDAHNPGPPERVELVTASAASPMLAGKTRAGQGASACAHLIGAAPQVDAASQFAGYLYEVRPVSTSAGSSGTNNMTWRPGLFVKAQIPAAHLSAQDAVAVPRSAVLYHQGRALVYVRIGPGRYERREVHLLGEDGGQLVLSDGVTPGEPVVYLQAQVLLSEEFRGDVDND